MKAPVEGPWGVRDNFRLNTDALEKVTISHGEDEESNELFVQFISHNKFSVYTFDRETGVRNAVLENCEI